MGERTLRNYISVLGVLAISLAASWVYWYGLDFSLLLVAGVLSFSVVFVLMDAFPVGVGDNWEISPLDVALVLSVVLLGPFWTMLAAVPCALRVGGRDVLRSAYEASRNTVEVFMAGIVFSLVSEPLLLSGLPGVSTEIASTVYATGLAAVALLTANHLLSAALLKVKYEQSFSENYRESVQPYLLSDLVSIVTCAVAVLALLHYGPVAALVCVVGAVGGQALVYGAKENRGRTVRLEEENRALKESLDGAGRSFGGVIISHLGSKDGYTHKHSKAVAVYARHIALEMKLGEGHAKRVETAGLLHDIGMLGLPEGLLCATGKLNSVARERLETHPGRAQDMLASFPGFEDVGSWIRWHHERPDGRGYPDRLRASWIPLESRILHVSEDYAAMILDRPGKPGVSSRKARGELVEGIGTRFDEQVVKAFLRILDTETEGYRMADDDRFAPERFDAPGSSATDGSARDGS